VHTRKKNEFLLASAHELDCTDEIKARAQCETGALATHECLLSVELVDTHRPSKGATAQKPPIWLLQYADAFGWKKSGKLTGPGQTWHVARELNV